ncbi:MAG: hypothetical protein DHS80DRAFT_26560 [Piptocephalis tieghemiana]|nr:MAG: hypothetical protein DHS80DRAFT_26560 [Piptocephalis tieghemiana]
MTEMGRSYSTITAPPKVHPAQVAVVGAGPAGFYCAARLLRHHPSVQIAIFDALPAAYGLSRYGVAPDHPEVKNCERKFEEVSRDPRVRLFLNTPLGLGPGKVDLEALKCHFDSTILAYGASRDRTLGIPGEDLGNVLGARAFVGWYNGAPAHRDLPVDLTSTDTAVVIGQGNVALDVARVLLSPIDALRHTDITEMALEALSKSRIRHVHVVGRRDPQHVAFTTKELRELIGLKDVDFYLDPHGIVQEALEDPQVQGKRALKRLLGLLNKASPSSTPANLTGKSWTLRFLASPQAFIGADAPSRSDMVSEVKFGVNRMEGDRAVATGESMSLATGLVVRSIGYKSVAIPGVPFDEGRSIVPNSEGRIVPGLYVAGWLKRGPTGTIATTLMDANETADAVLEDLAQASAVTGSSPPLAPKRNGNIEEVLRNNKVDWVGKEGWERIEVEERRVGESKSKEREKITDPSMMVRISKEES